MVQPSLLDAPPVRQSLTDRLAVYFRAHPDEWGDAHVLLGIAGFAGWRTRISELRHAPYGMTIENRMRRTRVHGRTCSELLFGEECDCAARTVTESCYRYRPEAT